MFRELLTKFHKWYANRYGYFWVQCVYPGCTNWYGGHQLRKWMIDVVVKHYNDNWQKYPYTWDGMNSVMCPSCSRKIRRIENAKKKAI